MPEIEGGTLDRPRRGRPSDAHDDRNPVRLLAVLALGLVARVAVIAPGFGTLDDPDLYLPLARSLARGDGLCLSKGKPTAQRPAALPAPADAGRGAAATDSSLAIGIAFLHIALGLGTIALTQLTGRRWGYGPARASVAALIVTFDPVLLVQSRAVMTETLAAFLVAACLASATVTGRRGSALAGVLSGLASLCRPSLLPGAVLLGLARFAVGPGGWRRRTIEAGLFAAGAVAVMAPWALRNERQLGEPVWTTTHGGYTLALANNPAYYADVVDGPPGAVWSGPNQQAWFEWVGAGRRPEMTPIEADHFLRGEALRMLRERPGTFLRASVARLGRFWGVAPAGAVYCARAPVCDSPLDGPLLGGVRLGAELARRPLALATASRRRWSIIGLTAVHAIYWTDMRMRVPIVPAIALVAAGAGWPAEKKRGRGRKLRWPNRDESLV